MNLGSFLLKSVIAWGTEVTALPIICSNESKELHCGGHYQMKRVPFIID